MGLLDTIYALSNSLQRNTKNTLSDLTSDPVGLLGRRLSQLSESLPEYPQSVMPGMSGGGLLNRPSPAEWGTGMAFNNPMMMLGPTVYHGSPYKFDKFDASKIGTGEARPISRGESQQDLVNRQAEENYRAISTASDLNAVPIKDLERAIVYLSGGITSLQKSAQRGEPYNKNLLDALTSERENIRFAIKMHD